jgi:hypothetical protein
MSQLPIKGVYKFYWDCGRDGSLEGTFVATDEEIKNALGSELYFNDVLGKHSEVFGVFTEEDITLVTADPDAVAVFEKFDFQVGYNPLDFVEER